MGELVGGLVGGMTCSLPGGRVNLQVVWWVVCEWLTCALPNGRVALWVVWWVNFLAV